MRRVGRNTVDPPGLLDWSGILADNPHWNKELGQLRNRQASHAQSRLEHTSAFGFDLSAVADHSPAFPLLPRA
jgi:hypothetical protein